MNGDVAALLSEQLAGQADRDPLTALLLSQLARAEDASPDEADILRKRLARATRTVERLRTELAAADRMAEHVARVLGACPACWGLDHFCRRCSGSGRPGSQQPDVDALLSWITPALQRAGINHRQIDEE